MASLDDLLSEEEPAPAKRSLDDLLSDPPAVISKPKSEAPAEQGESGPWWKRATTMGAADPIVGLGQVAQNVLPDSFLNKARVSVASIAGSVPFMPEKVVRELAAPVSTDEFNAQVRKHEGQYQEERKEAGREGLDWWRVGGALSNPVSWISPSSKASTLVQGIKAGAKIGAFQSLLQPVTSEGNFLWDKSMQAALGAGAGGTLGGALKMLEPAIQFGANTMRQFLGKSSSDEAIDLAADQITRNVTKTAVGDAQVNPDLYSAMRQEVADAMKAGVEPSAEIIARRADAGALPVPIHMTRGQLSRDPMQWAWEWRTSGQRGVGEPLSELLSGQNKALIENINALGARGAPSTYQASENVIRHIQGVDDRLSQQVSDAYKLVKDSAGRSARVSNEEFATLSKNALTEGRPELANLTSLADYLPPQIAKTYNDIITGKLPLTVDTVQFLDRTWGGVARGNVDDTTKLAVSKLRRALNDSPVSDSLGAEAMQAYKSARQLAAQRFGLIESNPAYKAVTEGVEPDKFFQKYVEGANVSEIKGLRNLVGVDNMRMLQNTFVGEMKRKALNKASDEAGTFSQAAYNGVLQDPIRAPRIQELFADNTKTLDQLYRLGRVSENLISKPAASRANMSNTAVEAANIVRDVARSEAGEAITSLLPNWMTGVGRMVGRAGEEVKQAKAVQAAVNPGVTAAVLPKPQQPATSTLSSLLTRGVGASAAGEQREKERD
jgi:hypothetical protein